MLGTLRFGYAFSVKAYNTAKNYYKILNLSEAANQTDIKKAYLGLAKKYHPDTNKGKQEQFKQINEAYQVLSSETTKSEYDQDRKTSNSTNNYQQSYHQNSAYDQNQRPNYHGNQSHQQYYQQYQYQRGPQYQNQAGRNRSWDNMSYQQRVLYETLKQHQAAQFIKRFYQQQQQLKRRKEKEEEYIRKFNESMQKKQAKDQKRYEQQYEQYLRQMQKQEQQRKQMMDKMPEAITSGLKSIVSLVKDLWNLWKNTGQHKK